MKRFLFILMLTPAGALAQVQPAAIAIDTTKPQLRALPDRKTAFLAQGKRSHTTSQGTIYIMPFDRMSCLVPDKRQSAAMPTVRPRLDKRMPNGMEVPPVKPNRK